MRDDITGGMAWPLPLSVTLSCFQGGKDPSSDLLRMSIVYNEDERKEMNTHTHTWPKMRLLVISAPGLLLSETKFLHGLNQ